MRKGTVSRHVAAWLRENALHRRPLARPTKRAAFVPERKDDGLSIFRRTQVKRRPRGREFSALAPVDTAFAPVFWAMDTRLSDDDSEAISDGSDGETIPSASPSLLPQAGSLVGSQAGSQAEPDAALAPLHPDEKIILSIDCGITNFSYCALRRTNKRDKRGRLLPVDRGAYQILRWEHFSLGAQTIFQGVDRLVCELHRREWMRHVDGIFVEAQIASNLKMKIIAHAIQAHFVTLAAETAKRDGKSSPSVQFIEAKSKFEIGKHIALPQKILNDRSRRKNKTKAVYIAGEMLRELGDVPALNFFNKHKKKDDLADSFLQGVYVLSRDDYSRMIKQKVEDYLKSEERGMSILTLDDDIGTPAEALKDTNVLNEGCEYATEVPPPVSYAPKEGDGALKEYVCEDLKRLLRPRWASTSIDTIH
jgi:hypothetical protein